MQPMQSGTFDATLTLPDAEATDRLGRALANALRAGDTLALVGDLGAGKSRLARAIIAELTGEAEAPSPTFGLALGYATPQGPLWHFDLYRLRRAEDAIETGIDEALGEAICLIEWAERIARRLPAETLAIGLEIEGSGRRARLRGPIAWAARLGPALASFGNKAH